jgi:hypothetical protein
MGTLILYGLKLSADYVLLLKKIFRNENLIRDLTAILPGLFQAH